jgi:hypothetical protein
MSLRAASHSSFRPAPDRRPGREPESRVWTPTFAGVTVLVSQIGQNFWQRL